MKTMYILIGLMAAGSMALAGSVTIPHQFEGGKKAMASEVNTNFDAVKNAVNDNADKINTNTRELSQKIDTISTTGNLLVSRSNNDVTIQPKGGYVAVHGNAFQSNGPSCVLQRGPASINFDTSSSDGCQAYASVSLPPDTVPVKFTCRYIHNDSSTNYVYNIISKLRHERSGRA